MRGRGNKVIVSRGVAGPTADVIEVFIREIIFKAGVLFLRIGITFLRVGQRSCHSEPPLRRRITKFKTLAVLAETRFLRRNRVSFGEYDSCELRSHSLSIEFVASMEILKK
jgi:hypothetical protein